MSDLTIAVLAVTGGLIVGSAVWFLWCIVDYILSTMGE